MELDFDVIIVGSGPAGVSVAFPLVEAGLRVLMVDGGEHSQMQLPSEKFLSWRGNDSLQAKWMIGEDFHALRMQDAVSPKLRVPSLAYVFENFMRENKIVGENFIGIGSLSTGGLSNAWGCGVARFSSAELSSFPFSEEQIEISYAAIAKRIGVSGGVNDDLSEYFGLDKWSQAPIPMDKLHSYIQYRYEQSKGKLEPLGFRMGRARVAALSEDKIGRQACNLSGNCLWGCARRSLYSSADELPVLRRHKNFDLKTGFLVDSFSRKENGWAIHGRSFLNGEFRSISAKKILLAAGTLATTRLVLQALNYYEERKMMSCPTAAFLVWLPRFLGTSRESAFGLGQLSFTLPVGASVSAFGSTFSTTGIPVSEFVRHVPFKTRYGVNLLRNLLSSCVVGNLFLPGRYSGAVVKLNIKGQLVLSSSTSEAVPSLMKRASAGVSKSYRAMGAIVLPGSFTIGLPGGDIHYAGTLPMRTNPKLGETGPIGEVMSLDGVHVVDGANLTVLPEKSHTFTIMANADRIGRELLRTPWYSL